MTEESTTHTPEEKGATADRLADEAMMPIGSVEGILKAAPKDITTETIEVPEWECSVKVKSFTAAQSARIRQRGIGFKGESTQVAWAEMEKQQFIEGVVEPKFDKKQVEALHRTSGRGFNRIIKWLDDHSQMDKEALAKAKEEFPESDESDEV